MRIRDRPDQKATQPSKYLSTYVGLLSVLITDRFCAYAVSSVASVSQWGSSEHKALMASMYMHTHINLPPPPLTCRTDPERGSITRSFLSLQLVASRLPSVLKVMLRMTSVWQSIIFTGSPISRFQIRIWYSQGRIVGVEVLDVLESVMLLCCDIVNGIWFCFSLQAVTSADVHSESREGWV